jgi:hypothetical protein
MQFFTPAGHLTEDSLGLHALNDLPRSQSQRADEHVAICQLCRDRVRQAKSFNALLRALARSVPAQAAVR